MSISAVVIIGLLFVSQTAWSMQITLFDETGPQFDGLFNGNPIGTSPVFASVPSRQPTNLSLNVNGSIVFTFSQGNSSQPFIFGRVRERVVSGLGGVLDGNFGVVPGVAPLHGRLVFSGDQASPILSGSSAGVESITGG